MIGWRLMSDVHSKRDAPLHQPMLNASDESGLIEQHIWGVS